MEITTIIWFMLGVITGTATWNAAMNSARNKTEAAVLALGYYRIQVITMTILLWLVLLEMNPLGIREHAIAYFLGTTIHPRINSKTLKKRAHQNPSAHGQPPRKTERGSSRSSMQRVVPCTSLLPSRYEDLETRLA